MSIVFVSMHCDIKQISSYVSGIAEKLVALKLHIYMDKTKKFKLCLYIQMVFVINT
jgi:hypothetical protein